MTWPDVLCTNKDAEDFVAKLYSIPWSTSNASFFHYNEHQEGIQCLTEASALKGLECLLKSYKPMHRDHLILTINIMDLFLTEEQYFELNYDGNLAHKLKKISKKEKDNSEVIVLSSDESSDEDSDRDDFYYDVYKNIDTKVTDTLISLLKGIASYARLESNLFQQNGFKTHLKYFELILEPLQTLFKMFKYTFHTPQLLEEASSCLLHVIEAAYSIFIKDEETDILDPLAGALDEIIEDYQSHEYHRCIHEKFGERAMKLKTELEAFNSEDPDFDIGQSLHDILYYKSE